MAKDESDFRTDEDSGYAAGSGRVVGHERVVTWAEDTRRYRRTPGGWWWLALIAIPLLLAALGTAFGDDEPNTRAAGSSTTSVTRSATASTSPAESTSPATSESSSGASTASESASSSTETSAAADCAGLKDEVGAKLADTNLSFPKSNAELSAGTVSALKDVAGMIARCPDAKVTVSGYTDASGSASENQRISQERADSVRQLLIDNGVAADQVAAVGRAAAEQIPGGIAANRRFEITVK